MSQDDEDWASISSGAKDFIRKLIVLDPRKRLKGAQRARWSLVAPLSLPYPGAGTLNPHASWGALVPDSVICNAPQSAAGRSYRGAPDGQVAGRLGVTAAARLRFIGVDCQHPAASGVPTAAAARRRVLPAFDS